MDLIFGKLLNVTVFIAGVFWVLAFLKNTNAFDFVKSHIQEWLSQSFQLGEFSINIASILLFLVSLYFAFYLSGLLNGLFYDEKRSTDSGKKTNLGSYIFLLRLMIISAGFVVGMLVAGIPLSNINLIIGAFSVGIGFGLQHIINNLISGIIIAFEKPIYVGDIIEVDGVTGKVTDIGMRATKVDTSDGAEYIIPNGELISKKMKNWTLSSKKFKVEMNLSVSH